jgi:hypothetical protein
MPTYYGFGLDNYQRIAPARPVSLQNRPEEPIERPQGWSRTFPLQHGELVSECNDFDSNIHTCLEEDTSGSNQGDENRNHRIIAIIARPRRGRRIVTASY